MIHFDVDTAYEALQNAETSAYQQPFIRTVARKAPGGSTAFGPVQITGNLAEDASKAGYLSPESQKFYDSVLKPKYELMRKNGNNAGKISDFNSRYDYGGDAEFDSKQHGQEYEMFAKDIIKGVANEANNDEAEFVKKWRGKSSNQDPEYYQRYDQGKKNFLTSQEIMKEMLQ